MKDIFIERFKGIYHTRTLTDNIRVCIVNRELLMKKFFPRQNLNGVALESISFSHLLRDTGLELSPEFASFRTFKRQIEWISGRIAFSILAHMFLGGKQSIGRRKTGEPYIEGINSHLSITHSGRFAAAAITLDNSAVAIDLEMIRSFSDRKSFLSVAFPEETENMASLSDEDIMTMWTLKEAFLKVIGRGLGENLRYIKILPEHFEYKNQLFNSFQRRTEKFDGHLLSGIWCDLETVRKCREMFEA